MKKHEAARKLVEIIERSWDRKGLSQSERGKICKRVFKHVDKLRH